jgi:hypothetical protein
MTRLLLRARRILDPDTIHDILDAPKMGGAKLALAAVLAAVNRQGIDISTVVACLALFSDLASAVGPKDCGTFLRLWFETRKEAAPTLLGPTVALAVRDASRTPASFAGCPLRRALARFMASIVSAVHHSDITLPNSAYDEMRHYVKYVVMVADPIAVDVFFQVRAVPQMITASAYAEWHAHCLRALLADAKAQQRPCAETWARTVVMIVAKLRHAATTRCPGLLKVHREASFSTVANDCFQVAQLAPIAMRSPCDCRKACEARRIRVVTEVAKTLLRLADMAATAAANVASVIEADLAVMGHFLERAKQRGHGEVPDALIGRLLAPDAWERRKAATASKPVS